MSDTKHDYLLGFDLGGTKMLAMVFDPDFNRLGQKKRKTKADRGAATVVARMIETVDDACADAGIERDQLAAIGIGSPGPLDPYDGVIIHTPNLGFRDFPLRKKMRDEFHVPVVLDNDVNVGTYGEFHFGAGRGLRHVLGLFPGTGIGGGLILDGRIYRGSTGSAGEIGHMILQPDGPLCGCGQRGCLEALASKTSLAKEAVAAASRGRAPTVQEDAGTDLSKARSKALARAFRSGDADMCKAVNHAARYLGIAMANAVNLLNPECIILGGGLVEAMPNVFVDTARDSMREHAMAFPVQDVQVKPAELEDDAVPFGAAKLAAEELAGDGFRR